MALPKSKEEVSLKDNNNRSLRSHMRACVLMCLCEELEIRTSGDVGSLGLVTDGCDIDGDSDSHDMLNVSAVWQH